MRIFITALMTGIAIMLSPHIEAYAHMAQIDFETVDESDFCMVRHQAAKVEAATPVTSSPVAFTVSSSHLIDKVILPVRHYVVKKNLQKIYCVFRE